MNKKFATTYLSSLALVLLLSLTSCLQNEKKELVAISKDVAPNYEPRFNLMIKNYCVPKSTKRVAFHVLNKNYHLSSQGIISDVDSDGISDAEESTEVAALFGILPNRIDSNYDKYSDNIVYNGMITTEKQALLPKCSDGDLDSDGLPDCAENILGTYSDKFDSDQDGISDELELFIGLNPRVKDSHLDSDMDGLSNYEELLIRTPIYESNHLGQINIYKLNYNLVSESNDQSQDCYTYNVNNITYNTLREKKNNVVEIYFHEEINGQLKQFKYARLILWSDYQALKAELTDKGSEDELPTFIIQYEDLKKKD